MIKRKAYAKFDLGINIGSVKGEDGYYSVDYVDCQLELWDELTFELQKNEITVVCNDSQVPTDETNFVFKTAELLRNLEGNNELGAKITIAKKIPVKAGFGGGSSDAAAALSGLSKLWQIKVNDSLIKNLSKTLGKDFFYSGYGGLCEVSGRGKDYSIKGITSKLPEFWVVIIVPDEGKPSTSWVYENLDLGKTKNNLDKFAALKKNIGKNDRIGILKSLSNDFEGSVVSHYPVVDEMKSDLTKSGAEATIMAGAGLSVVGFFKSRKDATACQKELEDRYKTVIVSKIIN